MKTLAALTLTALFGASTAFAANPPAQTAPGAAPGTAPATSALMAPGKSREACQKEAKEKKLTDKARVKFEKDCRAGTSS